MEDFDDYFNDDLVLDEAALAVLDQEEQKFLSRTQQQPAVTKKLKTSRGWSPGIGSRTREDEFDDLPEISVTLDGKYGFTDTGSANRPLNSSQARLSNPPQSNLNLNRRVDTAPSRPKSTPSTHVYPVHRQPPFNPDLHPPRHRSIDRASPAQSRPTGYPGQSGLEKQLAELQAQLHELKNEKEKMHNALLEATEIRYTKEGEVTIMRQSIEKTAELHAAEIAGLKAAKQEADARRKQIERQMKEETERLKTQFIFKQQELEASLRKPPLSARAARIMKNIPETPRRVPSQITAWVTSQGGENSTPSKPSHLQRSPRKRGDSHKSPEFRRPAALPGFQNSFMTTPLKLGTKGVAKGKGKDAKREDSFENHPQIASQTIPFAATPIFHQPAESPRANLDDAVNDDGQMDEDGDVVMFEDASEGQTTDMEAVEPLNHKVELSRVILMHTHIDASESTFQLLTGLPFSQKLPGTQTKECTQACQVILVALSNPVDDSDYPACAHRVTKYLILILQCLVTADPCFPLIALLNLISFLASSLPSLSSVLLSHDKGESGSLLLTILCGLAERLVATSSAIARDSTREMLSLLESLLCSMPDEAVTRLPFTSKEINSLMALLSASQPQELVEALSRVLMILATHASAYPQLSAPAERNNGEHLKDSPLIHGLCVYLLDNLDTDFNRITIVHGNLIGCLAQISLVHTEHLVESALVIPTLVYFVYHSAMKLWNADEGSLSALQAHTAIRAMNQGLFLLHNLVHAPEPSIRLHDKLQHSLHRSFNNLVHMFVVSFGQISYSDPPDWIDGESKIELEGLVEPARELLDLVMDGPESDSVWVAYQIEPENDSMDEEEIEARLMEADI